MDKKVTTTEITYHFNDTTGQMTGKTIVETVQPDTSGNDCEVETGIELEGIIETPTWKTILATAAGTFIGNVIYRVIKKMNEK